MTSKSPQQSPLTALEALVVRAEHNGKGLPPVESWHPDFSGDLDMEIKRDGSWIYMGTPISRQKMVRLFATVLRKDEDGKTYLVTPVEMHRIRIEDAHFIAVEMNNTDKNDAAVLTFRTNVGDVVEAGPDNPLRFETDKENGGLKPYLLVRGRLEALLARPVMYELMSHGEEIEIDGELMFSVRSKGLVFPIMAAAQLEIESRDQGAR